MNTTLGHVTHRYWWEAGVYYRSELDGYNPQMWIGQWVEIMRKAA
jgi:hypothetical protein